MPRDCDEIEAFELNSALSGLVILGDDLYLRMQASNVSIVDKWLMSLEKKVRIARFVEDEKDYESELFLGALSQMWLFAMYELLRTWRERAGEIQKWAANGGLGPKIAALEKDEGFPHLGRAALADLLKRAVADPAILPAIEDDLARTHILFRRLEFLRIALAPNLRETKAACLCARRRPRRHVDQEHVVRTEQVLANLSVGTLRINCGLSPRTGRCPQRKRLEILTRL